MRSWTLAVLCIVTLAGAAYPAQAAEGTLHARLSALAKEIIYTTARRHPLIATDLGIPGYDAQLDSVTEADRAKDLQLVRSWQAQLGALVPAGSTSATLVDRDDAKLLQAQLTQQIDDLTVYNADRKDYGGAAQSIVGAVFTQFQHLPVSGEAGATDADVQRAWNDITARLNEAPAYITAAQRLVTHPGHLYGVVSAEQIAGAPDFFNGPLTDTAKAQMSAAGFAQFVKARDATLATMAQTVKYIRAHAGSWPENYAMGRRAYDAMLRNEQLLPFTSNDVERMGADELAHGWAEEAWLNNLAQLSKTTFGPSSGGGLAPGGTPLIAYYRDRIADLRAFVTTHDVVTVPQWLGEIKVVETPSFLQPVSPGASMNPPRLFAPETTGYYFITPPKSLEEAAARLDMNQDFDRDRILSTAAHEAMPGHFMQLSIAKRHPDFIRKIQGSGVFAEGWAFYGEEMFVRLGLYGDDLDARLSVTRWERVRGARATVDPKLASGEWTYRQAADFFAQQTGFTKGQADAAVAGIALRPGYVISYTVGRLQLENLLALYRARTGDRGSLHDFHDRLLSYGTTPFAVVQPELLADLSKPAAVVRAAANY